MRNDQFKKEKGLVFRGDCDTRRLRGGRLQVACRGKKKKTSKGLGSKKGEKNIRNLHVVESGRQSGRPVRDEG